MNDDELKIKKLPPTWMVAYRHFAMPGGVFNYGVAEIYDFYRSFEEADKNAKKVFHNLRGKPDLHVWVLRCEKTYLNYGIAIEERK